MAHFKSIKRKVHYHLRPPYPLLRFPKLPLLKVLSYLFKSPYILLTIILMYANRYVTNQWIISIADIILLSLYCSERPS